MKQTALKFVQKQFPYVTKVVDATVRPLLVKSRALTGIKTSQPAGTTCFPVFRHSNASAQNTGAGKPTSPARNPARTTAPRTSERLKADQTTEPKTTMKPPSITQLEMSDADIAFAECIARKLGYSQNAYTSTSGLWGLFCLPDHARHRHGCIIKTREFGFLFVADLEDLQLHDLHAETCGEAVKP